MISIKVVRVIVCDEKTLLGNPIIRTSEIEKAPYKKVLKKLKQEEYDIITLKEYNQKIVTYCNELGIIPEEEISFLLEYFTKMVEDYFQKHGPLRLGIVFELKDATLAERLTERLCIYCKNICVPSYPRCRRLADKIMRLNGLKINLENSLAKFEKKCDSIINVNNLKISYQEDDFS